MSRMSYIPTIRSISNPLKSARLYRVLRPLISQESDLKNKSLNTILQECIAANRLADQNNKEFVSLKNLDIYSKYNEFLLETITRKKEKNFIFHPGCSIDNTLTHTNYPPEIIFYDEYSPRMRFPRELRRILAELNTDCGWNLFSQLVLGSVSPFFNFYKFN